MSNRDPQLRARRAERAWPMAAIALAVACTAGYAAETAGPMRLAGAGEWVPSNGTLRLQLSQELAAQTAQLRVLAAGVDVTALVRTPRPGLIEIDTRAAALAPGEAEIVAYLVEDKQWREVARAPLKLLTRTGFESASATPRLDLTGKGQFDEAAQGDATASPRPTYADLTGRGSLAFAARRGAFGFDATFNGAGSSYRPEALRYGELRGDASKVDLADYRTSVRYGGTTLALGHLTSGNNPMLLDGFASRGLSLTQRIGERFEMSVGAFNGTSIVGTDNFFGLQDAEHQVLSGAIGAELLPRAGALRADLMVLDASVQSRSNFNTGEIPDAEKSRGFGVRLASASAGNRVRGAATFARSSYVNPFDPLLAQGGAVQEVHPATANGYGVDVAVDLLRDSTLLSAARPVTVTTTARFDRIAPLFRSLGASLAADRRAGQGGLAISFAGAQLQYSRRRQRDNLDDVPTLLSTRTDTNSATASLPLAQWLAADAARSAWPSLNVQWQQVHQLALNTPVTDDSGFAASHRPDQLNRQLQGTLAWNLASWNFSYGATWSRQDNRQPGRELADFTTLGHQVQIGVRPAETLNLNLALQRNRNYSLEKSLVTYTNTGNVGFDGLVLQHWTLAANFSRTLGHDSAELATSADRAAQAQIGYRFEVPSFGHKLPGQVFVRYSEVGNSSRDTTFGLASAGSRRTWDAGFSFSFF